MRASLIIPTYNRGEVLCDTIEAALRQDYGDYEVIVVDQTAAHPPAVDARLNSLSQRIRYLQLTPASLPAARNLGVADANGDVLIFIDDDVLITSNYIAGLVKNFKDEDVGAVAGLTLSDQAPSPKDVLPIAKKALRAKSDFGLDEVGAVTWVNGGNAAYRREALVRAGQWDEYFSGSGWLEDADMGIRIGATGYRLLLDTRVTAFHMYFPNGGCENRNPALVTQREIEHMQFHSYYVFKNWQHLGHVLAMQEMRGSWREYVGNRRILNQGLAAFVRKQRTWIGAVVNGYSGAQTYRRQNGR